MNKLRTPEEAKAWLQFQGISVAQWCRDHGYPVGLVYHIINGRKKACLRGVSHNVAVRLGMKHGTLTTRAGRVAGAPRNSGASQAVGVQA